MVLWAHDIYPEIAERLGAIRNPVLRWWLHLESRRIYKACARIVVPGADMQATLTQRKEAEGKVRVIPNWADMEAIRPVAAPRYWSPREPVLLLTGDAAQQDGRYSGDPGKCLRISNPLLDWLWTGKDASAFSFALNHFRVHVDAALASNSGARRVRVRARARRR